MAGPVRRTSSGLPGGREGACRCRARSRACPQRIPHRRPGGCKSHSWPSGVSARPPPWPRGCSARAL
eukprot:12716323-Alexandrium_andersonii.AAC.1